MACVALFSIGVYLATRKLFRHWEQRADEHAIATEPAFGEALPELCRCNLWPLNNESTGSHEQTFARCIAAGFTPDVARPLPPERPRGPLLVVLCTVAMALGFAALVHELPRAVLAPQDADQVELALGDGGSALLERCALVHSVLRAPRRSQPASAKTSKWRREGEQCLLDANAP